MDINEILLLNHDQIDYASLLDETLKNLALSEDMFIATSALAELARRKSSLAASVAYNILDESLGDSFLKSEALETLFDVDRERALAYIGTHARFADSSLVRTMMELMVENSAIFHVASAALTTRAVTRRVNELDAPGTVLDPALHHDFQRLFPQEMHSRVG
jgi:hypothetical protein